MLLVDGLLLKCYKQLCTSIVFMWSVFYKQCWCSAPQLVY